MTALTREFQTKHRGTPDSALTSEEAPVELESVPCALCGGRDVAILFSSPDERFAFTPRTTFNLVACRHCGLRFLRPRPTPEWLGSFYPREYYHHRRAPLLSTCTRQAPGIWRLVRRLRPPRRVRRLNEKLSRIRKLIEAEAAVLEIGPGDGDVLLALRANGHHVTGMDIDPELVRHLRSRHGLEVHLDERADGAVPAASQDLVMLWNCFEHVGDPVRLLQRVARWLRPNGHLLMSVPNAAALERRLFFPRSSCEDIPRHLYSYSPRTLRAMLTQCGFDRIRVDHRTRCSTSELQQRLEHRFMRGQRRGSPRHVAFAVAVLPVMGMIDSVAGLARRGHTIVVSARCISEA